MPRVLSRRRLLRGMGTVPVALALPPLEAMFDSHGRAWAEDAAPVERRFVLWFNGNGIPEKYWIPTDTGPDFRLTPCLAPLAALRDRIHVVTGIDNVVGRGPGNGHTTSMSSLLTCTAFTGRGAGGISIDQAIAARIGSKSRFRSLQIGVAQESYGESMHRNMSWAGANRPLPPEMLPDRLFDRLFGQKDLGWVDRQKSVLDAVREDASGFMQALGRTDQRRLDEHLVYVRDLERAIASLPPRYRRVEPPEWDGDTKDWPRVAKLQTDLLVHALASRQTRVASYMLTKCQSLTRFPWLGHSILGHHDYTHTNREPGTGLLAERIVMKICRWHVEEFARLLAGLKAVPEGDGTVLDHSSLMFVHEHAEANPHKNRGHAVLLAGGGALRTGLHTRTSGTFGDLYLTVAREGMGVELEGFATANGSVSGVFAKG